MNPISVIGEAACGSGDGEGRLVRTVEGKVEKTVQGTVGRSVERGRWRNGGERW